MKPNSSAIFLHKGTRQNAGFAPVPSRKIYEWFIDGFDRLSARFSNQQRERLTAAYLMLAYTHGEKTTCQ